MPRSSARRLRPTSTSGSSARQRAILARRAHVDHHQLDQVDVVRQAQLRAADRDPDAFLLVAQRLGDVGRQPVERAAARTAMRQANSEIATVSAVTSTASSRSNLCERVRINAGLERYGLWLVCRS